MNLSLKCLVNYPMPKPYITCLEDLFDSEGGDVPKLVENNMTNKPMRPKSLGRDFHSLMYIS